MSLLLLFVVVFTIWVDGNLVNRIFPSGPLADWSHFDYCRFSYRIGLLNFDARRSWDLWVISSAWNSILSPIFIG